MQGITILGRSRSPLECAVLLAITGPCAVLSCSRDPQGRSTRLGPVVAVDPSGKFIAVSSTVTTRDGKYPPSELRVQVLPIPGLSDAPKGGVPGSRGALAFAWRPGMDPPEIWFGAPGGKWWGSARIIGVPLQAGLRAKHSQALPDIFLVSGMCWNPTGDTLALIVSSESWAGGGPLLALANADGRGFKTTSVQLTRLRLAWSNASTLLAFSHGKLLQMSIRGLDVHASRALAEGEQVLLGGALDEEPVYWDADGIHVGALTLSHRPDAIDGIQANGNLIAYSRAPNILHVMDRQGRTKRELRIDAKVWSWALSPLGDSVYVVRDRRRIDQYRLDGLGAPSLVYAAEPKDKK